MSEVKESMTENVAGAGAIAQEPARDSIAEVKTIFDGKALDALFAHTFKKLSVIFFITSPTLAALGFMMLATESTSMAIFCFLFAVLYPLGLILLLLFSKRKQRKTMAILSSQTINYFAFGANSLRMEVTSQNGDSKSEFNYAVLYRIDETKMHYFLYISNAQAYVVPKADFISGNQYALNDILRAQLGKKFKGIKIK